MSGLYPYLEAAVLAACLAVILFPVAALARQRGVGSAMRWAAVGVGWFLLVWELARSGAFEGTRAGGRLAEVLVILVPLLAGSFLLLRERLTMTQAADLVTLQTCRVAAAAVLVAYAGEALPGWLALPIGVGDVALGIAAPWVARRARTGTGGPAALRVWNVSGAVIACYTMGAPVISAHASGYFFSLYPLVLFPTFLAPAALLGHLATGKKRFTTEGTEDTEQ